MRILFCASVFFLVVSSRVDGQAVDQPVTNVNTQVSEERDKVTITYDLARRPNVSNYNVKVKITLDGEIVPALALSGDVGPQITSGYGKRIVWDVFKDVSELYGSLQVEVTAIANAVDCVPIKTVPVYAGLAGAGAAGLTLIISGLQLESDSDDLYEVYKNNLDPNASVYNELSRDEHYDEANSKHKKGAWFTAGGAAVIAAGGFVLVSRLIQIKKYNKRCEQGLSAVQPRIRLEPTFNAYAGGSSVSAGFIVYF